MTLTKRNSRLERALSDPSSVYGSPQAVLDDSHLSATMKKVILRQWEQDARLLQVAEEEAMDGGEGSRLGQVREALRQLGKD